MTRQLRDDCFLHDKDRLAHDEAIAILKDRMTPLVGSENVPLEIAAGRIASADVGAPRAIPAHDNAAVDGYAFRFDDYDAGAGSEMPVAGRVAAGHPITDALASGVAVRIFTGAAMPGGFDTVVMQEDVETLGEESRVRIPAGLKAGANRRLAGEDVQPGEALVGSGQRLRPQDIAAIASAGHGEVSCYERLRVGILSSGDEVIRPGEPFIHGQVYDANSPMLQALISTTGSQADDLGIMRDDPAVVGRSLSEAAQKYNLIITSGGASLGEEDHIISTLDRLGTRHLWQIAVKPGRPMTFGQIGDCVFVGLPGNPVAVFVCFLLYAWPLIMRASGAHWPTPARYKLPAAFTIASKKPDRREFWRGLMRATDAGPVAEKFARDGSGLISGLTAADGLIEVGEAVTEVREGDEVNFIPFAEFGIPTR
ncbi:MAG: gephyrin-like molybdotransferase Glp [Hyphomicrobiaceae bacterium]